MGSLLARAYKRILSGKLAQDAGEHWVTVNAGSKEGGEGGGSHVLLDGEGRVVAGMGGKFKGQNIDRIERKKFINSNAWNRQRKALTEKAGDDTQLKRVVTAGMRSQAEKEADKSNDTWQKEGLYNALVRRTQRENRGMINVLHEHLDYKNAQPKTPNPIAEKIQKQSDGVKQIVTEAITKYNDLEAVNQLHNIPDGVNVVTEKGQFFKTGDLWSSPDGKKTLEHDQMLRQLKKELKGQISNKDMDNLMSNELEKVQYKDVAERVKDIDPQLAKEIENTEKKYNKLKAENIAKAERSEHEKRRGGGHAISFEEQNTEKKLQELKAQAETKIAATPKGEEVQAEAPKAENKGGNALLDSAGRRDQHEAAYKERAKIVKELRKLNVSNPGEDLTFSKYGRTFKRIPDLNGNINTNWREVGRKGEPYKPEYTHEQGSFSNEKVQQYKEWHDRREQWIRDAGLDPIKDRPQYFYDKATNTESFRQLYDPNDTWIKYDDNLPEKDYKFFKEAKQRAKDAGLAVKEEQPRGMKNAFSDKYQKIDNSNLNKYQKVDNISNNKNTENGVTNMNTNQESQATPIQQAEGKQYHGTGIENKNGRYEVSFNEFPSYKLRTDMKANGFRWDPNAKVWHTADREKLDQVMSKHFTEKKLDQAQAEPQAQTSEPNTRDDAFRYADDKRFNYATFGGKEYVRRNRYSSWSEVHPESKNGWGVTKEDYDKAKADADAGKPSDDYNHFKEQGKRELEEFFGRGNTRKISNQYRTYNPVLDNDNIILATNNIKSYRGKDGEMKHVLLTGPKQGVFLNPGDLKNVVMNDGQSYYETTLAKISRDRFKPYTFKEEHKGFLFDKNESFDDLLDIAKSQDDGRAIKNN